MTSIDLAGKVALVTGGSRGIGAATAQLLTASGARVAITYLTREAVARDLVLRMSQEVAAQTDREIAHRPIALQADVSSREDCERVVEETIGTFGQLDIFVANAGVWPPRSVPLTEMSDDQWRHTLAVNLDSMFYGCRAALKAMQSICKDPEAERWGRIVVVSSTAAQRGEAYHADYAATKGAVNSFVKSLAVEAAPWVTVNAVAPGWVDTEMCQVPFGEDGGKGRREIESGIPLQRVASAADVAGPILFLCSKLARHVTGEILNVNGGSVLCG
jgi:3-oxoacyl-[acyl-carrier protein] reductase